MTHGIERATFARDSKSWRWRRPEGSAEQGDIAGVQAKGGDRVRMIAKIVWPAAILLNLAACSKTIDWAEEAPLHDGRVLRIERHSELGSPFPGNSGMEIGQSLAFTHPDTGERIAWHIPDGLNPVMIDFDQRIPYYVFAAHTVSDYNKWGCPNPPYLVYRFQQGKWTNIPFEALPVSLVSRNLIPMSKDVRGLKDGGRVYADEMENLWARVEYPTPKQDARRINREKVNPIANGCYPDVLNEQGRQAELKINYPTEASK